MHINIRNFWEKLFLPVSIFTLDSAITSNLYFMNNMKTNEYLDLGIIEN